MSDSNIEGPPAHPSRHAPGGVLPSAWVRRFAALIAPDGPVLDLACGAGRHTRLLRAWGHPVTAVDRDLSGIADLAGDAGVEAIEADVENAAWPLGGRRFAGVVVANYLWRPLFPALLDALAEGGVLIYETFAKGNARFGKPRNPEHLLAPGELLARVAGRLHVVAFEHGMVTEPRLAAVQRLCAVYAPADADGLTPLPPAAPLMSPL